MSNDTRHCNSCATTLPADATECSKCGAKQHTEPSTLSSFELLGDDDLQEIGPPPEAVAAASTTPSAPEQKRDSSELDPLELEPSQESAPPGDAEAGDEIELEEVAVEAPNAPEPDAGSDAEEDESAQTGETVRMSMHDVVQAWNEEAEAETHSDPAPTTLGEAEGLPKGFWPAIIACVVILASALVLLLG